MEWNGNSAGFTSAGACSIQIWSRVPGHPYSLSVSFSTVERRSSAGARRIAWEYGDSRTVGTFLSPALRETRFFAGTGGDGTVARYGHVVDLFFTPRAHVNHINVRTSSSTCERGVLRANVDMVDVHTWSEK